MELKKFLKNIISLTKNEINGIMFIKAEINSSNGKASLELNEEELENVI